MAKLYLSMRAADAARHFAALADEAKQAIGRDGAMEYLIDAEPNGSGQDITIVVNNDDMERHEMSGRTIVEFES